jgi:hypothetical protein
MWYLALPVTQNNLQLTKVKVEDLRKTLPILKDRNIIPDHQFGLRSHNSTIL